MIDRTDVGSGGVVNFFADPEGCLANLIIWPLVPKDRRIECSISDHDCVVADRWMAFRPGDHEGGKDDKRVGISNQKTPMF